MRQVTIYLDEETAERARRAAADAGVSVSQWVRETIQDALDAGWRPALQRVQEAVRRHVPAGDRLSDELIADRRSSRD